MKDIQELTINTIRFLAADGVQKACSGHPGLPMGAAPAAFKLWASHMKHSPEDPFWPDRDRFILSAGHGSMLLYSLLHLFGYKVSLEDLKNFRQFGSMTPGHPEYGHTPGVETTTGPLGQGLANGVGFALAESRLAAHFNRPEFPVVDHYTYVLCGDGCLMEGVSAEAVSLAGTWGLGKLIVLYDSNNITIEGSTDLAFTENVQARFSACGWHTLKVEDGTDLNAISQALDAGKQVLDRPTLIEIKTKIGFGSPNKEGRASAHGEPLGVEELALSKKTLLFEYGEDFHVPEEVRQYMDQLKKHCDEKVAQWRALFDTYKKEYPALAEEWAAWHRKEMPEELLEDSHFWQPDDNQATRSASGQVLNRVAEKMPNLIGGAADLSPSTKTVMTGRKDYCRADRDGSNLHFGVREFAMTAIAGGVALHGGLRPYISGFFVFTDYMKAALRMQALMGLPVISILTHDSIGVGEDGPTHQPVEQLAELRSIPNFITFRPCDSRETAAGWASVLSRWDCPSALILTRQNLPGIDGTGKEAMKGAYILRREEAGDPRIILMGTGSEVQLLCSVWEKLKEEGVQARVVSMPSWELFEEQTAAYKESVLPSAVRARLAVEALSTFGWHRYTGLDGDVIGMESFGASAPAGKLFEHFGFTVENVLNRAKALL